MAWKWFRFIILLIICGSIYYFGQLGFPFMQNPIPPIFKLVNPYTGFWQNDTKYDQLPKSIVFDELNHEVIVSWDERRVPHIFAKNDRDLYFTQGYFTAKNRLWQMDFLSRAAAGRLSEVVGARAVEFDRFNRKIGLLESAQLVVDTLKSYPEVDQAIQSYAEGVNAYIEQLTPKNLPFEFKLMNYKPEKWTALKSALILKYMAWDLDGGTDDRFVNNARIAMPDELFQEFYPLSNPYYVPIVNKTIHRVDTIHSEKKEKLEINSPSPISGQQIKQNNYFLPYANSGGDRDYQKGSNNWVVNGSKTKSGNPILANDPHLSLSLPSLWFEVQLVSDDLNVYGASLPGVPMVVIGFNESIAWGLTYATSDPIDFYKVELSEDDSKYKIDDHWTTPRIRIDTIKVKGTQDIIDKTIITKAGPIIYLDSIPRFSFNRIIPGANIAFSWTANQPTLEFVTMYQLNRANNLVDYQEALPYFKAPGQNFVFASNQNDIAIWHNGMFPIRNAENARFVNSHLKSEYIWDQLIPFEELPHSINPESGYLFSANQSPIEHDYPYYLGADDYATFERSNRINEILSSSDSLTIHDFQQLQLDNKSILAEKLLPFLLEEFSDLTLDVEYTDVLNELRNWNYEYDAFSKSPIVFQTWLEKLRELIFMDEAIEIEDEWMLPRIDVMTKFILTNSTSNVYDHKDTQQKEDRHDMIVKSFQQTIDELIQENGSLNDSWSWGSVNPTRITSLANLKGFGSDDLMTGGSKRSVNAISGNNGPSWRMIVELGERPQGYGIYPGGQTGNPGSPHYDDFIDEWARGEYFQLLYMKHPNENAGELNKTTLNPNYD